MKYFLLCALLLSGAFFSSYTHANNNFQCDVGEVYIHNRGCGIPAPEQSCEITLIRPGHPLGNNSSFNSLNALLNAVDGLKETSSVSCSGLSYGHSRSQVTESSWSVSFTPQCPDSTAGSVTIIQPIHFTNTTIRTTATRTDVCTRTSDTPVSSTTSKDVPVTYKLSDNAQCPDTHPLGPIFHDSGEIIGNFCYRLPPQPECDCANYAGDSLTSYNSLVAPVGQYTRENPPQCVQQREWTVGRDDPLICVCQVSAQKWISSLAGSKDGVEYERWETLPTQIGQPSGTFTGVKCSDKDGGPQKPEDDAPKECFTTKTGLKWCWADKNEKCQIVNGVEQCVSGCGTVNGDFVCYEDTPVIPPRERDPITDPDDNISDPNKPVKDLVKGDLKDVNRGIEQRLNNVVTTINNSTKAIDDVGGKISQTNNKLDGLGRQLDGMGRQLGAIDGSINANSNVLGNKLDGIGDILGSIDGSLTSIVDGLNSGNDDSGDDDGSDNGTPDGDLDGISEELGDIKGILEGTFGKDGKGGKGKGMPGLGAGDCVVDCSWYESAYPDGIVGIWQEHSAALQQTPAFTFLNQFKIEPDGAQPDFNFCFNMGALGDYGCKSLEVPSVIWAFLKMVILISAAFLCRALIFGG